MNTSQAWKWIIIYNEERNYKIYKADKYHKHHKIQESNNIFN